MANRAQPAEQMGWRLRPVANRVAGARLQRKNVIHWTVLGSLHASPALRQKAAAIARAGYDTVH